ncbi:MAG: hypothetical protein ACOZBZ_02895 [Patescibacteria group bacterium]
MKEYFVDYQEFGTTGKDWFERVGRDNPNCWIYGRREGRLPTSVLEME